MYAHFMTWSAQKHYTDILYCFRHLLLRILHINEGSACSFLELNYLTPC
jgi:hypothetical protein